LIAGTCSNVYYIYDLPFWKDQNSALQNILGGWQISGASFFRTGLPFSVTRTNDIAGVGDGNFGQPYSLVGDPFSGRERTVLRRLGNDQNFVFNPAAFAAPAAWYLRQLDAQHVQKPGRAAVGHRVLQEFPDAGNTEDAVPGGDLQLHQPPELGPHRRLVVDVRLHRSGPEQRQLRPRDRED
jgi:hypothetical protein